MRLLYDCVYKMGALNLCQIQADGLMSEVLRERAAKIMAKQWQLILNFAWLNFEYLCFDV